MTPGAQFSAPGGFRTLVKGRRYHFIYRDEPSHSADDGRVVLAWFSEIDKTAHLVFLAVRDFDYGLDKRLTKLLHGADACRFPPWLRDRERDCPQTRPDAVGEQDGKDLSDGAVVDGRFDVIASAVDEWQSIFASPNPIAEINAWARENPSQNQKRFRNWFITYIAFGFNRWSLLPTKSGRGRYDRQEVVIDENGHDRLKGSREQGYTVSSDMKKTMKEGFIKFAALGKTLAEVYEKSLTGKFGCTFAEIDGEDFVCHPEGKPFPSYGQFRYWIVKELGDETVWTKLRGNQWYRTHRRAPRGSYSEGVQDLLEKVYTDAASSTEMPKSYLGEGYTPPLVEVVIVDGVSRMRVGVAFGVGAERESLYKQALASMALPTSVYAEVLNLPGSWDDRLPVRHIPLTWQSDRGPGAAASIRKKQREQGMSSDMTPSYTPQSNSEVEGVHRRDSPVSGAPTFKVSALTPLAMARQRFIEITNENRKRGITARLTPEEVARKIRTPLQLWNHRLGRGRIAGRSMTVEDVVTTLLPERVFKVVDGFLEWAGQRFRSSEFNATRFATEIRKHEGEPLTGYSFDISNLVAWVVVEGRLIKVNVVRGTRDRLEEFALTSFESEIHASNVQSDRSKAASTRRAVGVRNLIEIPQLTGMPYRPERVVKGRSKKRTADVQAELSAHQSL